MDKENLRVLQLGKFYPIRGGVEKVAYDLMVCVPHPMGETQSSPSTIMPVSYVVAHG